MKLGDKLPTRFIYVYKHIYIYEFSTSRRLAGYLPTPTDILHFGDNRGGEDQLDPNWVTGFVDAEVVFL